MPSPTRNVIKLRAEVYEVNMGRAANGWTVQVKWKNADGLNETLLVLKPDEDVFQVINDLEWDEAS